MELSFWAHDALPESFRFFMTEYCSLRDSADCLMEVPDHRLGLSLGGFAGARQRRCAWLKTGFLVLGTGSGAALCLSLVKEAFTGQSPMKNACMGQEHRVLSLLETLH